MNNEIDVVGVGNAIVDVIASVKDNFLEEYNIRKGGMTLVDQLDANELARALRSLRVRRTQPTSLSGNLPKVQNV